MAKVSKGILLDHAQRYIQAVMKDRLLNEGFVSNEGKDIHWYRIINNTVIQSVYFVTRHSFLPIDFQIGYGCHPLFIPPLFPNGPYLYAMPGYEQIYPRYLIMKNHNQHSYAPNALVTCPADEYKGYDILEKVLMEMPTSPTVRDCYEMHKKWHARAIEKGNWLNLSPYFVDEVVYWDDKDLYPFCKVYLTGMIQIMENVEQTGKINGHDRETLTHLRLLNDVLSFERRDEHLVRLKKRENQTLQLLKKHTGLCL